MKRIRAFAAELLRRKVIRLVGAYIAILWLLAQGYASLYPAFGLSDWTLRAFIVVGVAVIPFLAFFSWKYDLLPPQVVRDVKDLAANNPALSWARARHEHLGAGYVLLRWTGDDRAPREKRFFHPVSIGREPSNDVELADPRVSRYHAVLWAEDGAWCVRDLDSANGTFIGYSRVDGIERLPQTCDLRFHPNGPVVSLLIDRPAETMVT